MSGPTITVETLLLALDAAAYAVSDVVELCALQKSTAPTAMRFARMDEDLARAAQWIRWQAVSQGRDHADGRATEGGLYVGSNPLLTADGRRACDADVREVRLLLLDVDPVDASPEARGAAAQAADALERLLGEVVGVRPVRVDSGRGRQLWLRHEAFDPGNKAGLDLRRRLLCALAARLDVDLAKIDRCTHNPSRLMRLPGTINLRTGEYASVLDRGDGRVLSLVDLERLVRDLAPPCRPSSSVPPPPAPQPPTTPEVAVTSPAARRGAGANVAELSALVAQLPPGDPSWAWLGAQAARAGVVDLARGVVPGEAVAAYDTAVAAVAAGAMFASPTGNSALRHGIARALQQLALPPEQGAPLRIGRLVHYRRARSLGGHYDLEVSTVRGSVVIRGVPGKELRSYSSIAARTLDGGLLLPDLPKRRASAIWLGVLEEALSRRETVELPAAGEDEVAIEDEIRAVVDSASRGEGVDGLDQGELVEVGDEALITPKALVRAVRDALQDAPPTRADVLRVAEAMGGRVQRSRWIGDQRRDVVAFRRQAATGDAPAPP